jgi:hypothetical protein
VFLDLVRYAVSASFLTSGLGRRDVPGQEGMHKGL